MSKADAPKEARVLVVEDDELGRHALSRLLSLMGFAVTEAATVAEGLARLEGQSSLILDLNLPDGDGSAILHKVRETKSSVKVAVYTGSDDSALLSAVIKDQPDGLFSKPVDLPVLLNWIAQSAPGNAGQAPPSA